MLAEGTACMYLYFFFKDTATTEIYTLSLHDALPIFGAEGIGLCRTEHMFFDAERIVAVREMILADTGDGRRQALAKILPIDRKSTRLNSSHANISYAVFCLKKIQLLTYLLSFANNHD